MVDFLSFLKTYLRWPHSLLKNKFKWINFTHPFNDWIISSGLANHRLPSERDQCQFSGNDQETWGQI